MNAAPYILIGGASTRFGGDKAMFDLDGETLAMRAVRIAENSISGSTATFVAARPDQFPSLNERHVIFDTQFGRGVVGAVSTALTHASAEWTFVLACDLPFVSAGLIQLIGSYASDDVATVVPAQPDGRWQPLCAFYRTAMCRDVFESAIRDPASVPSLRAIIENLNYRLVVFPAYATLDDANHLLENINKPTDLDRHSCAEDAFVAK